MMTLNILMIIAIFMAMALSMSDIAFASVDPVGTDLSGTDNYSYNTVYETDDETAWTMIVYSGEFGAVNQEDDI